MRAENFAGDANNENRGDVFGRESGVEMQVMNLVDTGILIVDLSGTIQQYNEKAVELLGWRPVAGAEGSRLEVQNRLYYADGAALPWSDSVIAACIADGQTRRNTEYLLQRPGLQQMPVALTVGAFRDKGGRQVGVICNFEEVTPQEKLKKALSNQTKELQDYVDNANIGLHWVDEKGIIKWANQAELDMLG